MCMLAPTRACQGVVCKVTVPVAMPHLPEYGLAKKPVHLFLLGEHGLCVRLRGVSREGSDPVLQQSWRPVNLNLHQVKWIDATAPVLSWNLILKWDVLWSDVTTIFHPLEHEKSFDLDGLRLNRSKNLRKTSILFNSVDTWQLLYVKSKARFQLQ